MHIQTQRRQPHSPAAYLKQRLHCAAQVGRRDALDVHRARSPGQRKRGALQQLHGQHKPGGGQQRQRLRGGDRGGAGEGALWEGWGQEQPVVPLKCYQGSACMASKHGSSSHFCTSCQVSSSPPNLGPFR